MSSLTSNLYGNYTTKKFSDIYATANAFISDYASIGIPSIITQTSATTLYYLLYARYGNTPIANSDENQFKYKLFSVVWQYGPTWEKRLDIQSKLRNLSDDEILTGAKQIYNHAYNPATEPSTGSLEELEYINEQNTTSFKKSKLDAYNVLWNLLTTDVTESFLTKFANLFIKVVIPDKPLWYVTDTEGEDE